MARKEIVIIGAGMGGLAAGIYAQASGYRTRIFESHAVPGGQAATWRRKGYSFDGCVHHLFGCRKGGHLYGLWQELGVMPREMVRVRECVAVVGADGRLFTDYYDLGLLEQHLKELSPRDATAIDEYIRAVRRYAAHDFWGEMVLGSKLRLVGMAPSIVSLHKWFKPTMADWAERFSDPFLRRAFPLLEYSLPEGPALLHVIKHAYGLRDDIRWPIGGAAPLARSMADRYQALGGELHLKTRVAEILTEGGRARGVRLAGSGAGQGSGPDGAADDLSDDGSHGDGSADGTGTIVRADAVISNADGRATITDMLGGRFVDQRILEWCKPPADDETNWAVHVFLGVDRDLSAEPSALVLLLDEPVEIAGRTCRSIEMQTYGMDLTMAPPGKGVIKVELFSRWGYWQRLLDESRESYEQEKRHVADQVIAILEQHWPGLRQDVEVVDVPTLQTWQRYMGGHRGFLNMPNKPFDVMASLTGRLESTLPGLQDFRFVGSWASSAGALFMNALSGRKVVQDLCKQDGRRFTAPS